MPRLMSFAKTVPQILDGSKTVTRRDGWLFLKPDDLVEGIEWNPRVGKRFECCGEVSSLGLCDTCGNAAELRWPRRLGVFRVKSVGREQLQAITWDEVLLEGFPGKSPEWFIRMYCAPGKPDPLRAVTRIEFEPVVGR